MKALWLTVVVLFAPVAASAGALPVVTMEQLLQAPSRYDQKIVRLVGQVDNCIALDCRLCPAEMTRETFDASKCLGLAFSNYGDASGASEYMETAFRFATVEMDVAFDATCINNYRPPHKESRAEVVCTDRGTLLTDARVVKILSRKSARDGLIGYYDFGNVSQPAPDDRTAMLKELSLWYAPGAPMAVFALPNDEEVYPNTEAHGLGCVCRDESCDGKWPKRWFAGFESPANPFQCDLMVKMSGVWRVTPYSGAL